MKLANHTAGFKMVGTRTLRYEYFPELLYFSALSYGRKFLDIQEGWSRIKVYPSLRPSMEASNGSDGGADSSTPLLKTKPSRHAFSLLDRLSSLLQDWWLWEILGAITCVLALSIILIILAIYDSRSLPDWPSVFTVRDFSISPFPVSS